jgi:hypothetical protein
VAEAENSVRDLLRTALREGVTADYLRDLLEQVKTATFRPRAFCTHCRKIVYPELPDHAKTVRMLAELVDQAEGRPGVQAGDAGGVTLVVERVWWGLEPGDAELLEPGEAALLEQAAKIFARLTEAKARAA